MSTPNSPQESTGLGREFAEAPAPEERSEALEGERDIPSVNARRAAGGKAGGAQKAATIAFAGIAVIAAVAYYWPQLQGKKQSAAAATNTSGVVVEQKKQGDITTLPTLTPTEVKAQVDAEQARLAEAEARRNKPLIEPIPLDAVNAPPPPGSSVALVAPGAANTQGQQQKTPEEIEAERKKKAAEDLIERRKRSPLIAYGGTADRTASAASTQGGSGAPIAGQNAGGRTQPLSMDQATAIAQRLLEQQQAAGRGTGIGGGPATPTSYTAAGGGDTAPRGELASKIQPTSVAVVTAAKLPNRDLLMTQGTFIDCTLETALDSTVAGFTRCVTTRNVYSNSGRVILLERGTKIIGQYQGGIKQGQSRIFVLWTRAETPHGVVINLDSPGTDELGSAGLPGEVDTKFWTRFGGALLLSIIQDSFDLLKREANGGQVTTTNTQAAAKDAASVALESTINIPPVLYKNQGEKVNITIARDLDFSSVYTLRLSE